MVLMRAPVRVSDHATPVLAGGGEGSSHAASVLSGCVAAHGGPALRCSHGWPLAAVPARTQRYSTFTAVPLAVTMSIDFPPPPMLS